MRSFQGAPSPPAAASSQSLLSASDDLVFFPCPPCAWAVRGREIDFPLPPESGFEFSGPPRYSGLLYDFHDHRDDHFHDFMFMETKQQLAASCTDRTDVKHRQQTICPGDMMGEA